MTDDDLIAGAAAPAAERMIRSRVALDSVWVACVALLLIVSSFLPLVDLENVYLRTADAPLRVYTVGLPVVALAVVIVGALRRSALVAAAATGILVPAVAFAGSVASSLFFDAASPFTDAGVPVTLAAATVGLIMLLRWFIYRPTPSPGIDAQPPIELSRALIGVGLALVVSVIVDAARDDDPWSLPFALSTLLMMLTPFVVISAGLVRSVEVNVLAGASCVAQVVAVVVVHLEDDGVGLAESATTLRSGAIGIVLLAVAAALATLGAVRPRIDAALPDGVASADDASWRWSADDA